MRKRSFKMSYKSFHIGWKQLIYHNLFVTRSEIYPFLLYIACGGWFSKKFQFLEKEISF